MISGRVVSIGEAGNRQVLEPQAPIAVASGIGGVFRDVDCAIDTGFTAWLALPPSAIRELGLRYQGRRRLRLANSRQQQVRLFIGFIEWHGQILLRPVHELNGKPLLGMGLLTGSRLTVESVAGGEVSIEEITTA